MKPFTVVTGPAAPLMVQNVDTDIMIRIERLMDLDDSELGPYCFEVWRYHEDGSENSDFVLNQKPWRDAPILLAGSNFGCGSSREGAVTALVAMGVRTVIAPSFGGIFFNNCLQNGILPIQLPDEVVEFLAETARTNPNTPFEVNLNTKQIIPPCSSEPVSFDLDEKSRLGLLLGLDDLGLTLERNAEITNFQKEDEIRRPWVYLTGVNSTD